MASFNKVILVGNLTKDPELRTIKTGTSITNFSVAINRKYKYNNESRDDVCFLDIVVWSKQAENCVKYLRKGSQVLVEGYLNYRQWETKDHEKRNKLEIVASNIQFLNTKNYLNNGPNENSETEETATILSDSVNN